jgi:uncharacterized membrane protein
MTEAAPVAPAAPVPAPASLDPRSILALAGLTLATSVAVRGARRSARLLAVSATVATAGEVMAIRGSRILRHHSRPQVGEVPPSLALAWYAAVAPAYGLAQAAVGARGAPAVAALTALLATATDLANDPMGLASGYWEWRDGGGYVRDVVGANGAPGTPAGNYLGWLVIAGSAALLAEAGRPPAEAAAAASRRTLLLANYAPLALGGLLWALRTGRLRLLAFATAVTFGLAGGAWRAAGGPGRA